MNRHTRWPELRPFALTLTLALVATACGARNADIVMNEAVTAHRSGERRQARSLYGQALRIDPSVSGAANNLAALALDAGLVTGAIASLEAELARHPDLSEALLNRALALVRLGDHAAAEAEATPVAGLGEPLDAKSNWSVTQRAQARLIIALARFGRGAATSEIDAALEGLAATALTGAAAPEAVRRDPAPPLAGSSAASPSRLPDDEDTAAAASDGAAVSPESSPESGAPAGAAPVGPDASPLRGVVQAAERLRAVVAVRDRRWADAATHLDALAPRPRLVALVHLHGGDPNDALAALDRVVPADDPHAALLRASALSSLERREEARRALAPLLRGPGPGADAGAGQEADEETDQGAADGADDDPAPRPGPDAATPVDASGAADIRRAAWWMDGALASRAGDWTRALTSIDRAMKSGGPPPPALWLDRAVALAHGGRLDDARRDVAGVRRDWPADERARELEAALE